MYHLLNSGFLGLADMLNITCVTKHVYCVLAFFPCLDLLQLLPSECINSGTNTDSATPNSKKINTHPKYSCVNNEEA